MRKISFYRVKQSHRAMFTILELLIVVAIMFILAALLFPALQAAKDKSKQITCMNNLKQIGFAVNSYAGDYNGCLPLVFSNTSPPGTSTDQQWLLNNGFIEYLGMTRTYSSGAWHCNHNNKLVCPSDRAPLVWTYYDIKTSYAANTNTGSSMISPPYYRKIPDFRKPSSLAWAVETHASYYCTEAMPEPGTTYGDQIPYAHNNGMNVLYLDSHTSWRKAFIPYYAGGTYYPTSEEGSSFWFGR